MNLSKMSDESLFSLACKLTGLSLRETDFSRGEYENLVQECDELVNRGQAVMRQYSSEPR